MTIERRGDILFIFILHNFSRRGTHSYTMAFVELKSEKQLKAFYFIKLFFEIDLEFLELATTVKLDLE